MFFSHYVIFNWHIFRPESAKRTTIGVKEGDIILVGTDGLFDNLSDEMILHHVSEIKVGDLTISIRHVAINGFYRKF